MNSSKPFKILIFLIDLPKITFRAIIDLTPYLTSVCLILPHHNVLHLASPLPRTSSPSSFLHLLFFSLRLLPLLPLSFYLFDPLSLPFSTSLFPSYLSFFLAFFLSFFLAFFLAFFPHFFSFLFSVSLSLSLILLFLFLSFNLSCPS